MNTKTLTLALGLALAVPLALDTHEPLTAAELQGKKPKLKPTVHFAKTWDAAVEEAKLLHLPIVVHSHGFY
ncbi:MAG: hypothetical protein R3F30_11730 [Planctomycetota bacterium]